jgi:hypothetical protein
MSRRLLLAVCAVAFVPCFVACGDDDDDAAAAEPSPTLGAATTPVVAASTASPLISGPASRYSVNLDELGNQSWRTDVEATFQMDAKSYAERSRAFRSPSEGTRLLREWGYLEGYQTAYIPELPMGQGGYHIGIETHLFKDEAGARQAFTFFDDNRKATGAAQLPVSGIGNQGVGFLTVTGTISTGSSVNAAYHQVVMRRGNAVIIILTKGAVSFMKLDPAFALARFTDQKLLGERSTVEPTPTSNYATPTTATKP